LPRSSVQMYAIVIVFHCFWNLRGSMLCYLVRRSTTVLIRSCAHPLENNDPKDFENLSMTTAHPSCHSRQTRIPCSAYGPRLTTNLPEHRLEPSSSTPDSHGFRSENFSYLVTCHPPPTCSELGYQSHVGHQELNYNETALLLPEFQSCTTSQ
jgi:hypothetical protein